MGSSLSVAKEYQNIGLVTILQKLARTMEPAKPSGGFTPAGRAGFARVHREFVRDALKNGTYSSLVKSKQMTMERVKEIVKSAHIEKRNKPDNRNLSSSDPKDWLLFVGEYGDFILYDKKLKDLIEEGGEQNDYFIENMIKGAVNIQEIKSSKGGTYGLLTLFGGDSDKIKQFMMKLALSFAATEGFRLYVDQPDIKYATNGSAIGDINLKTGYKRQEFKLDGEPIIYNLLSAVEKQFRKKFDRYDEFKDRLMELAYGKY